MHGCLDLCRYKTDVDGLMKACFKSSSPPDSLRDYLTYVHGLDYKTTPDYSKCRQMFVRELSCLGLRDDGKDLDWTPATSKVSLSSTHTVYGDQLLTRATDKTPS